MAELAKKYPNHRVGNCQKCSRTFGSLGCCDTFSNEWRYYCEDGQNEWEKDQSQAAKTLNLDVSDVGFLCDVLYDAIRDEAANATGSSIDYDLGFLVALCSVYEKCKIFMEHLNEKEAHK